MADQIIPVTSGQVVVDTSVVPFIRKSDVEFNATDLKPYKEANFFFDEVNVNRFVQRPSELVMIANGTTSGVFTRKEGILNDITGAYATVVDYIANTIYLNENYVSMTLTGLSLAAGDYSIGDVVYQNGTGTAGTNATSNTFSGKVTYWNSNKSLLVVSPLSGNANSISGAANAIFKVSGRTANIASILGKTAIDRFSANQKFFKTSDLSQYDYTSTYTNYSGQIISVNSSLNQIHLPTNASSSMVGSQIKITSGTGVGQYRTISGFSGNTVTLSAPSLSVAPAGDSRYSIGNSVVDAYGKLSGIFNIPEDPLMKFKTGERIFTITDASNYLDSDAQMKVSSKYVASGILNKTQEIRFTPVVVQIPAPRPGLPPIKPPSPTQPNPPVTITPEQPTPVKRRRRRDPVAQTFFTPEAKNVKQNYGIFVTSVDLYFKSKPSSFAPQLPVTVRIVSTDNGYPTENILAAATVFPSSVNTTDGTTTVPSVSDTSTRTKFTFANPVYLNAATEYAIVVFSESPDYEVWISELGENIIGTSRRVSDQPYAGSFFRSQNASTWTPFQNQDLMFVINKALFSSNPATLTFKVNAPIADINLDEILLHSTDLKFPCTTIDYSILTTFALDNSSDTTYIPLVPNEFYRFGYDLKNSAKTNNRRRIVRAGNSSSLILSVSMSSTDNAVSPMFNTERLSMVGIENLINNGSLTSNNITITSRGGLHSNASNITVTISAPTLAGGTQAYANVLQSAIVSGNITAINIYTAGSGYVTSPTITINETTVGVTTNATAVINSEDSSFGGNAKARYLTRKITLADGFDAGDLRVFLNAVRPKGTNVVVYYKVLSSTDPENFYDKKWKKMEIVKDIYSLDQESTVELQFRPNTTAGKLSYTENGIEYPLGGKFKNFAVKIVLLSEDTTVVPYVTNFRAIATPEG